MSMSQTSSSPSAESHSENGYEPLMLENGWRIGGPDWRKPWPSGLMFLTWFGAGNGGSFASTLCAPPPPWRHGVTARHTDPL